MQKQFPLSFFVFVDSLVVSSNRLLVVSALQDAGGNAVSRQDNPRVAFVLLYLLIELFYIGMPVVQTDGRSGGRAVCVRSRDYQIFSDG